MKCSLILIFCLSVLSGFSQKKKEADAPKTITVVLTEEEMITAFYLLQTGKTYIFDNEGLTAPQAKKAYKFADSLANVFTTQAQIWHPAPPQTGQPKSDSTGKK
jgi:hypothetical protein